MTFNSNIVRRQFDGFTLTYYTDKPDTSNVSKSDDKTNSYLQTPEENKNRKKEKPTLIQVLHGEVLTLSTDKMKSDLVNIFPRGNDVNEVRKAIDIYYKKQKDIVYFRKKIICEQNLDIPIFSKKAAILDWLTMNTPNVAVVENQIYLG